MGPDFRLQRIRVQSVGFIVDPETSGSVQCQTLHPKHPDYVEKGIQNIHLIGDYYVEPGECNQSE